MYTKEFLAYVYAYNIKNNNKEIQKKKHIFVIEYYITMYIHIGIIHSSYWKYHFNSQTKEVLTLKKIKIM